jgi:hypothetical protein
MNHTYTISGRFTLNGKPLNNFCREYSPEDRVCFVVSYRRGSKAQGFCYEEALDITDAMKDPSVQVNFWTYIVPQHVQAMREVVCFYKNILLKLKNGWWELAPGSAVKSIVHRAPATAIAERTPEFGGYSPMLRDLVDSYTKHTGAIVPETNGREYATLQQLSRTFKATNGNDYIVTWAKGEPFLSLVAA